MRRFIFCLQRFGEEVTLNKSSFLTELNNLIATTNVFFDKKLKAEVKAEAEAKLADYPNSDKSWETFKKEVSTPGDINEKNKIPKKVWQAIMQGAIAKNNAIKDIPSLSGLNLDEDANNIISSVGGYLYSFLKNEPVKVKDGNDTYAVNVTAYSTATVTIKSKTYNINWANSNSAKTALNSYLGELKTYFKDAYVDAWAEIANGGLNDVLDDVFNNLGAKYDGIAESIYAVIKECVQKATGKVVSDIFSIFKKDSTPIKTIKALDKNYSDFLKKANDLKGYVTNTGKYDKTAAKKYNALIAVYNKLGLDNTINGLVDKYLTYKFSNVTNGEFNQQNASISGTSGADSIRANGSEPKIIGGADNDCIIISGNENTITGGLGNDTIFLLGASESVIKYKSGDGNDLIVGYEESTTLKIADGYSTQTSGQDVIISVGNSSISLVGASGKQININNTNKVIGKFTSGEVTTYTLPSFYGTANYVKYGTNGDDYNSNYEDNVFINMLAGNDHVTNKGSSVTIYGGAGNDSIQNGGYWVNSGNYYDSWHDGGSNVTMDGGAGDDYISNSGDSSNIDGGAGNDSINNNGSNAVISGGEGNDYITNRNDSVTIDGGTGNDSIVNGGSLSAINGGEGNDYITNSQKNVTISGGAGNDSIYTSGDNVSIDAGKGNDTINNSYGNVFIKYSGGNDLIKGFNSTSTLKILSGTYSSTVKDSNVIVTVGKGKITLEGAASLSAVKIDGVYKDPTLLTVTNSTKSPVTVGSAVKTINASARTKAVKITGNKLANTISGGSKNDSIYGGSGNDSIVGNAGNDKLFGGEGNDSLASGAGNDTLDGGPGNDSLSGGAGNDCILGDNGSDTLVGGKGNDSLWGNAGADKFIYEAGDGKDIIFGFDNKDTLTFDNIEFTTAYSQKINPSHSRRAAARLLLKISPQRLSISTATFIKSAALSLKSNKRFRK